MKKISHKETDGQAAKPLIVESWCRIASLLDVFIHSMCMFLRVDRNPSNKTRLQQHELKLVEIQNPTICCAAAAVASVPPAGQQHPDDVGSEDGEEDEELEQDEDEEEDEDEESDEGGSQAEEDEEASSEVEEDELQERAPVREDSPMEGKWLQPWLGNIGVGLGCKVKGFVFVCFSWTRLFLEHVLPFLN